MKRVGRPARRKCDEPRRGGGQQPGSATAIFARAERVLEASEEHQKVVGVWMEDGWMEGLLFF